MQGCSFTGVQCSCNPPVCPAAVRLIDLVQQPIPWFGSNSQSVSSTDITYDNMTLSQQPWAPDILEYLRAELGTKTLGQGRDPRLTGKRGLIAYTMQLHELWVLDAAPNQLPFLLVALCCFCACGFYPTGHDSTANRAFGSFGSVVWAHLLQEGGY